MHISFLWNQNRMWTDWHEQKINAKINNYCGSHSGGMLVDAEVSELLFDWAQLYSSMLILWGIGTKGANDAGAAIVALHRYKYPIIITNSHTELANRALINEHLHDNNKTDLQLAWFLTSSIIEVNCSLLFCLLLTFTVQSMQNNEREVCWNWSLPHLPWLTPEAQKGSVRMHKSSTQRLCGVKTLSCFEPI